MPRGGLKLGEAVGRAIDPVAVAPAAAPFRATVRTSATTVHKWWRDRYIRNVPNDVPHARLYRAHVPITICRWSWNHARSLTLPVVDALDDLRHDPGRELVCVFVISQLREIAPPALVVTSIAFTCNLGARRARRLIHPRPWLVARSF